MKFKTVLPAVLFLGMAAVHAQNTPAPVVNQTLTGAPITMKLVLTPGQVRAYKITVNENSTVTMPGAGQGMPVKMDMTSYAKLFVDKQNPDGTYAVRFKTGGTRANVSMNGSPVPMPNLDQSMEVKGTMAKDGSFKADPTTPKPAGMGGMGMDLGQTMSGMFAHLMSIPDRPVSVGDTWVTKVPLPMDPSGSSVISATNKILGVDTVNGQQIARVQTDYSGPLNITMTQPAQVTMTGTIKGTGTSRVDVASGQTIDNNGTVQMTADMVMANPAGNGESMKMKMDMTATSRIESTTLDAADLKPGKDAKPAGAAKGAKAAPAK